MILDIKLAVIIIIKCIQHSNYLIANKTLRKFSRKLVNILLIRFKNYWFEQYPNKYACFRSIRINNDVVDISIQTACVQSKLPCKLLQQIFCDGIIIIVNPGFVSFKINESYTMYIANNEKNEFMKLYSYFF